MKTVHCAYPKCDIVESIPKDAEVYGKWYCRGHRWAHSMSNLEIEVHEERREKTHSKPPFEEKLVICLTDEQAAEIRAVLAKHHSDPTVGLRPSPQMTFEVATTIAQQAAKRLADCTLTEARNDVWAAAMTKVIENELYAFLRWMFNERDNKIMGLIEDSYSPEDQILPPVRETIETLVTEFSMHRKSKECTCSRIDVTPGPDGMGIEVHQVACPQRKS